MFIRSESKKKRESRVREIMKRLDAHYGDRPMIFLEAKNAWQLLFATILSAQCTDARVNMVTEKLFVKYKDLQAFADCDLKELEEDIHSTGFYHNKAKNMKACAKALVEEYGGEVPQNIEALTALPGVGRKTGNLILGNIYHIPSIVVDTHVKRISNRLGLADSPDPTKVEFQLMEHLPEEFWIRWNTHIIALGRTLCTSQNPKCGECYLQDLCPSSKKDPETWRPVGERKAVGNKTIGKKKPAAKKTVEKKKSTEKEASEKKTKATNTKKTATKSSESSKKTVRKKALKQSTEKIKAGRKKSTVQNSLEV